MGSVTPRRLTPDTPYPSSQIFFTDIVFWGQVENTNKICQNESPCMDLIPRGESDQVGSTDEKIGKWVAYQS